MSGSYGFTEKDVEAHIAKMAALKTPSLSDVGRKHGFDVKEPQVGKQRGETLRLVLPFKLPTWNQLLAMDHWQRRKVRNWIKERVSECIAKGEGSQTQTGFQLKLSLTDSYLQEYSEMITPNSSKRYRTAKKSATKKKLLLR